MIKAFRILHYVIVAEVVIQAAAIAWAIFGLGKYLDDDKSHSITHDKIEGGKTLFTGEAGFAIHGINGAALIPLLGLACLVVAFFTKLPGAVSWAATLFVLILVQAFALPALAGAAPFLGMLHGANALLILWMALQGGRCLGPMRWPPHYGPWKNIPTVEAAPGS